MAARTSDGWRLAHAGEHVNAAVFTRVGEPPVVEDLMLERPRADEVRIRVVGAGVCHSDLRVVQGAWLLPTPIVLGHEGAGTVVEVGDGVRELHEGDHVMAVWASSCGACRPCRLGKPWLCEKAAAMAEAGCLADGTCRLRRRTGEDVHHFLGCGLFAEEAVLPSAGVVRIREDAPLDIVGVIGCAIASGYGAVVNTAAVEVGCTVVVLGVGAVGLAAVQAARLQSAARVIAVDVVPEKLRVAERCGATDVVNAERQDPVTAVLELIGGADYAIDCAGLAVTQEQAVAMLGLSGTAVMVGLGGGGSRPSYDPVALTCREQRIVGSYFGSCVPGRDLPRLVDLYMSGELMLDEIVTRRRPLREVGEAFDDLASGRAVRTILIP